MYLKYRHSGVHFLLFVITLPCCLTYFLAGQKAKSNVEDYGERLSSLERENKRPVKLSGVDHKTQEDVAQEEGISLQDIPIVKLELGKSSKEDNHSQPEKTLAQYTISTAENSKEQEPEGKQLKSEENSKEHENEDKQLKSEENSKEHEHEDKQLKSEETSKKHDPEDKQLKSEENSKKHKPDEKPLKSEEKDVKGETDRENNSKIDVTEEHQSSTVKQSDDKVTLEDEAPTKCTTDRAVTIGNYTPQESHSKDEGHSHGDDSGGNDDGGKSSKEDIPEEDSEKKVSKVYKGPKPAKAPDHYIDDV